MIKRLFTSLIFRLTALFLLASLCVLLLVGFLITQSLNQYSETQDREILTEKLDILKNVVADVHDEDELQSVLIQLPNLKRLNNSHGLIIFFINRDDKILYSNTQNSPPADIQLNGRNKQSETMFTWQQDLITYRVITMNIYANNGETLLSRIIIGKNITEYQEFLTSTQNTIWITLLAAIGVMGICGWIIAKNGLSPLYQLVNSTSTITVTKLDQRLPTKNTPSELVELTHTLNNMLERLEQSFKRLSDFSSDLAHELRTPLSALRTQTQVILSMPRSEEEYRDVLYSNAEELDHLTQMIADMLFLAKTDNGLNIPRMQYINIADEIRKVVDFYVFLAEEKGIKLHIIGNANINGDSIMLRRAFSNLIMNAITYSYENTEIKIAIEQADANYVYITVENHGDTIAPEHLPHLFDRFYRLNDARQSADDGVGLGLAITYSIIRAHGGDISADSSNNITRFIIKLQPVNGQLRTI